MLGFPPSVRIYFAVDPTDMRKGIDGLRASVEATLRRDPCEGHLFVFAGKAKDKVKILFCARSGVVLYLKRLEKGASTCPSSTSAAARRGSRSSSTRTRS
ncbi:MAG: hypothetical protein BGO98_02035 [Myxococcales bacterium 68-20]|nr:IS66 family insertion sequence element accessory protein TnpB [Myxococcales bacterium]OJY20039.1 MAG: hypothetical protein BGO98_02035 [Myxococcales bacterium 68-20]